MIKLTDGKEFKYVLIVNVYCQTLEEADEKIRIMEEELSWDVCPDTIWEGDKIEATVEY